MALDVGRPVEIPTRFSRVVDVVLDEFVEKESGWEAVHWYHDEPIWFIRKQDGPVIRRVQISAFRARQNHDWALVLKLIPSIYRVESERAVSHGDPALIRDQIQTIRLDAEIDEKALTPRLREQLFNASKAAANLEL